MSDGKPSIYDLTRVGCGAWPMSSSSTVTVVTKDLDRAVSSWAFTPDSKMLYVTAEDAGHERIYAVPVSGGAAKVAVDAAVGVYTALQIPQKTASPILISLRRISSSLCRVARETVTPPT